MADNEVGERLKNAVRDVQAVAAVGSEGQMRSVMNVFAESAIVVAGGLSAATDEIRSFSESTTQLSEQVLTLNKRLLSATWAIAAGTGAAAVATVILAYLAFRK